MRPCLTFDSQNWAHSGLFSYFLLHLFKCGDKKPPKLHTITSRLGDATSSHAYKPSFCIRANSHKWTDREPFQKSTSTVWQSYKRPKVARASHLIFHWVPSKSAWKWILAPSLPCRFLLCHIRNLNQIPNLKSKYDLSFIYFFHSICMNEEWNRNKVSTNYDLWFFASSTPLPFV